MPYIPLGRILRVLLVGFPLCFILSVMLLYYYSGSTSVALVYLNQVSLDIVRRVTNPNFKPSAEESFCQQPHAAPTPQGPVPRTVHFVWVSPEGVDSNLSFDNYLSIKAALVNIRPDRAKLHHYSFNEDNEWWQLLKDHIELVPRSRNERLGPHGNGISDYNLPHQADFLRLDVIHREGGIYMDGDVFALRSFDPLLNSPRDVILGHEGANRYGLCNGVIVARPQSRFMQRWIDSYITFDDASWNYHSVRLPKVLAARFPDDVCTLSPVSFFWPTWAGQHIDFMHEPLSPADAAAVRADIAANNGSLWPDQLAYHAWGQGARGKYLTHLTPERLRSEDTRFNLLLRRVLDAPL